MTHLFLSFCFEGRLPCWMTLLKPSNMEVDFQNFFFWFFFLYDSIWLILLCWLVCKYDTIHSDAAVKDLFIDSFAYVATSTNYAQFGSRSCITDFLRQSKFLTPLRNCQLAGTVEYLLFPSIYSYCTTIGKCPRRECHNNGRACNFGSPQGSW